jgi:hypothetical protein
MSRRSPVAAGLTLLLALPVLAKAQCSLTHPTTWCAHQDSPDVGGGAEDDDRFAGALAFGDFNGDGFDDLAVGAPGENDGAGFVHVFYSDGFLLSLAGQQLFSQDQLDGGDEGAEDGDELGAALAAGDFNADGFDDLVIGSPGEDLPEHFILDCALATCDEAGGVHVVYGSPAGLLLSSSEFFDEADFGSVGDTISEHARLGASLAVANVDDDPFGFDDLAVGMPETDDDHGEVYAMFGSNGGLNGFAQSFAVGPSHDAEVACAPATAARKGAALSFGRFATESTHLIVGLPGCAVDGEEETGSLLHYEPITDGSFPDAIFQVDYASASQGDLDQFGSALATGDFDADSLDDVAAGAPGKNHGAGNPNDSGRVYVAYGAGAGPDPGTDPDIIGEDEWAGDTPGEGERFGTALAAGDVDGDGFDDLLAGAPNEGSADIGRVYLKRGSVTGLTTVRNELFTQTFLGGSNGDDDHLGNVIALGDVDGDGALEIALGVPDKDVGTADDAGMVYVTRAFGQQLFRDGFETGSKARWSASTP